MKNLAKKRRQAIREAIKQPDDFEAVLSLYGYSVVNKQTMKNILNMLKKKVM